MSQYTVGGAAKEVKQAQLIRTDPVGTGGTGDTVLYVGLRNFRFRWGVDQVREKVIESEIPRMATGAFSGEGDGELIVSTDLFEADVGGATPAGKGYLLGLSKPGSAKEVPTLTFKWEEKDTQSEQQTATWVLKLKITSVEHVWRGDNNFQHAIVRFELTEYPSVTVA